MLQVHSNNDTLETSLEVLLKALVNSKFQLFASDNAKPYVECYYHLRNTWIKSIIKEIDSHCGLELSEELKEMDSHLRVAVNMSITIRTQEKLFSLTSNYTKGDVALCLKST